MTSNKSRIWALAMNGARARIVRGLEPFGDQGPVELVIKTEARHLRQMMSERPGGSLSARSGSRGSAIQYSGDPVAEDRREFIRQVVALLESHRRAGDLDRLVIFAEHDVLGNLHRLMPETLRAMVLREVPKNLLHLSESDLQRTISAELNNGPHVF